VVVDNGSTDQTDAVIGAWAAATTLPLRVVQRPEPGLGGARNAGIAVATGSLLAFTDDDCVLQPGYVDQLLAHYAADTQPVIRGGRVALGDPRDLPFTIKLADRPARMMRGTHPGTVVLGCNMVIPRAVLDRLGGFDERFGAGTRLRAAEDADYVYRAHLAGIAVEYVPDMAVSHFHGRRRPAEIARLNAGYALGNGALYAKHLRRGWLIRHLGWDLRRAWAELFGGERMDRALGLTYRRMLMRNVQGMALYWIGACRHPPSG
jgi:GT2 family glycosyltransferase